MPLVRIGLALLGATLAFSSLPAAEPAAKTRLATPAEEAAAAAWVRAHGRAFDPDAFGEADLAPILTELGNARVYGIGEATHGGHQDQAFKAELIKALVRGGKIDLVAIECNRPAAAAFDLYVRTGEGDPVALVRSTSFFRIWKGDEFAGLLMWLRAWNLSGKAQIGVVGIDNQDGARDADAALTELATRDPAEARAIREAIAPILPTDGEWRAPWRWIAKAKPEEFKPVYAAITRLRDRFDRDAATIDTPAFREAHYAATIAWQNFNEFELDTGDVDVSKLPPEYLSRRDRFMAGNLIAALGKDRRAALWAHDGHIYDFASEAQRKASDVSLGSLIKDRLGAAYRTVGFTYSRATVLATARANTSPNEMAKPINDVPTAVINDRPGELGHMFDRAIPGARAIWAPLRRIGGTPALDRWHNSDYFRGWLGWLIVVDKFQKWSSDDAGYPVAEGFDVVVWFARMTPQHRWPGNPVAR